MVLGRFNVHARRNRQDRNIIGSGTSSFAESSGRYLAQTTLLPSPDTPADLEPYVDLAEFSWRGLQATSPEDPNPSPDTLLSLEQGPFDFSDQPNFGDGLR